MPTTKFKAWKATEGMNPPVGFLVKGLDKPVTCGQCPMRWMLNMLIEDDPDHYYDVCGARPDLPLKNKIIDDRHGPLPEFCPIEEYNPNCGEWISVKDWLPEDRDEWGQGIYVLATDGVVTTRAFYGYPGDHDEWFINAGEQWEATFERPVTHWMPLPDAPQDEWRARDGQSISH